MVAPRFRTRSKKVKKVRTPGARTVIHYKQEKPKRQHCARCGRALSGVPNDIPVRVKKLAKSQRSPTRHHGGVLCGNCTEVIERYKTLFEAKFNYPDFADMEVHRDLTIEKYLPPGWWKSVSGV